MCVRVQQWFRLYRPYLAVASHATSSLVDKAYSCLGVQLLIVITLVGRLQRVGDAAVACTAGRNV